MDEVPIRELRGDDRPAAVRVLPDPPARMWARGPLPPRRAVAVVGSRSPTPTGARLAAAIGAECARRGWAVVSGLAPGIDAAAHRGCLDAGGRTWAVVGWGVDVVPPDVDGSLARRIVAAGGGLLAEVAPGTPSSPAARLARDRIQAALARAVVVVETELDGGATRTAADARSLGRPLAVVAPGPGADPVATAGSASLVGDADLVLRPDPGGTVELAPLWRRLAG